MRRELSQWWTPDWVAQRMGAWVVDGPHETVLEPAAGQGALLDYVPWEAQVVAYEIDHDLMQPTWPGREWRCADFLEASRHHVGDTFDCAVLNPPYEKGLDGAFLERCMECSDRVVALLRINALCGLRRYKQVWAEVVNDRWWVSRLAVLPERPDFGGPHGARSDYCAVELRRAIAANDNGRVTQLEWWLKPVIVAA